MQGNRRSAGKFSILPLDVSPTPFPQSYFTFLILKEVVSFTKLPQNTCQLGRSQIIINKIMTASVKPPPPSLQDFGGVSALCACGCVRVRSYSW